MKRLIWCWLQKSDDKKGPVASFQLSQRWRDISIHIIRDHEHILFNNYGSFDASFMLFVCATSVVLAICEKIDVA